MDEIWSTTSNQIRINQNCGNTQTLRFPSKSNQWSRQARCGMQRECCWWNPWKKGHTITGAYYTDLLKQLWENIKKMCRKLTRGVLFHQDKAPANMYTVAMAPIQECRFQLIQSPPYLPDLTPSDYFFPKVKELSGNHFASDDDVSGVPRHRTKCARLSTIGFFYVKPWTCQSGLI